jgi:DNA polymerase I
VNFGLLYGMQAFGLSRDTGLSRAESQDFINEYWARLPKVRAFLDETLTFGAVNGYVQTLRGRRRLTPDLNSSNPARRAAAVRMATNMPLQGTAADIMKAAMIEVDKRLTDRGIAAALILQVHDELVLEVSRPALEETIKTVTEAMESAYTLSVPLITEVKVGENWDEMEEITA